MVDQPAPADDIRQDAVQCPHCEQITMPNLLADGSLVCSCSAEKPLPAPTASDAAVPPVAAPMDTDGPLGGHPPDDRRRLPPDHGQFGRDVATEDYPPLRSPPAD